MKKCLVTRDSSLKSELSTAELLFLHIVKQPITNLKLDFEGFIRNQVPQHGEVVSFGGLEIRPTTMQKSSFAEPIILGASTSIKF